MEIFWTQQMFSLDDFFPQRGCYSQIIGSYWKKLTPFEIPGDHKCCSANIWNVQTKLQMYYSGLIPEPVIKTDGKK